MRIEIKSQNVCTRGKQCVGSLDGKKYRYADGSTDEGTEIRLKYVYYEDAELLKAHKEIGSYECWDSKRKVFIKEVN